MSEVKFTEEELIQVKEIEDYYQKTGRNFRKRYHSIGFDPENLMGKP